MSDSVYVMIKRNKTKRLCEMLLLLFYPSKCPFCGEIIQNKQEERKKWEAVRDFIMGRKNARDGICLECRGKIPVIHEPICKKCGKPIRKNEEEFCYDCERKQHSFEEGRSLWVHKPPVSEAVYAFKYQNRRVYGTVFGTELATQYEDFLKRRKVELIIPIPLHKSRKRWRGYNQAEILAAKLAEKTGISLDTKVLRRIRRTNPQKQLDDRQRKKNIKGAFAVSRHLNVENVVLIDDIYTTGSTLDEAAKVLKEGGVEKVYFLTISIGQGF